MEFNYEIISISPMQFYDPLQIPSPSQIVLKICDCEFKWAWKYLQI
jgi:hypothetical protein